MGIAVSFSTCSLKTMYLGAGGGGGALIWPIQVCAAEQGMFFKDWKPFKQCEDLR